MLSNADGQILTSSMASRATYDDVLGNTALCLVKCSFSREILKERMEETRSSSELEEQVATLLEQNAELKRLLVESATTGSNILAHNKELKQQLLQLQTDYAEKQGKKANPRQREG